MAPIYETDIEAANFKGEQVTELREDSAKLTYLEGNSELLNQYLSKKYKKEHPSVAYFGDQYTSDVHFSNCAHPNWHGIAVIEEFMFQHDYEDVDNLEPLDPKLIPYTKYWGDCYFIHSLENPNKNWYVD